MDSNVLICLVQNFKEHSFENIKKIELDKAICVMYKELLADKGLLHQLEQAGLLENLLIFCLDDKSSNALLLTITMILNYKISQKVNVWEYFSGNEGKFTLLLNSLTTLRLKDLNNQERFSLISFLISCFQSIEVGFINSQCNKLVNLPAWLRLSPSTMKESLILHSSYIQTWKKIMQIAKKTYDSKESYFINFLLDDFLEILESEEVAGESLFEHTINFLEKFIELIIDLLSQVKFRRLLLPLLKDRHFLERCQISRLSKMKDHEGKLFNKLIEMLQFYYFFEINEETGESVSQIELLKDHYERINNLQKQAFRLFPEKLSKIYLKNISLIDSKRNLIDMLNMLDREEILRFATSLQILKFSTEKYSQELLFQVFVSQFEKRTSILEEINNLSLFPTESLIWDEDLIPDEYENSSNKVLAIPKLNLQFLTHHDYLLRNFKLFRLESTYQIRQDFDEIAEMVSPKFDIKGNFAEFEGWARMAAPIKNFKILTVKSNEIGKNHPAEVIAEIEINLQGIQSHIKAEWDQIKKHEVLFFASFGKREKFFTENGVVHIRGAEVINVQDQDNHVFYDLENSIKKKPVGNIRKIHVWLDPVQYKEDLTNKEVSIETVYSNFQLLVRKKAKESNFKSILETIRDLINSVNIIPKWLEQVFLGYDTSNSAHYTKLSDLQKFKEFDLKDTFIDPEHFKEALSNSEKLPNEIREIPEPKIFKSKEDAIDRFNIDSVDIIRKYEANNLKVKRNIIRFTKAQVEAIISGVNHGLTLVVGPPGTGKTDVAVQIISLILHNHPNQRTLIVTHSNQALNDLFEKITKLDINERYLLRLGMGEKDLSLGGDFSTNGRVNFMLKRRLELLNEVLMLAQSINFNTYSEYTCETAINFYKLQIKSRWSEYEATVQSNKNTKIEDIYPFTKFFQENHYKGETLFSGDFEKDFFKTKLFNRYINNLFTEIEECYAFELLRNNYERGNYLLTKQAKIIAMTCTYAALKRKDFLKLGLEYDNILIEEAGQILEIETYIPLLLQRPKNSVSRLKRVIMIGDNNQLPPIIKNNAFKIYGKMDQSMFSRFIRLNIPHITLNYQGRTRTSIARLFSWRYKELFDLPHILASDSSNPYNYSNAGLAHEYQFVNVPDFNGFGETCPSPFYYQNLAEAEYMVATYMYLCLVGYNPKQITMLTTYNGQKYLLKDIINQKCSWHPLFQTPMRITTVDKYQGQQNDIILLSLVRSKSIGHIRDIRRLMVALSRARHGLYIFGRYDIFASCFELRNIMELLSNKPLNLEIVVNERHPTNRTPQTTVSSISIKDFAHMYNIVQELIKIQAVTNQKKQEQLRKEAEREVALMKKQKHVERNEELEEEEA